MLVTDCLCLIGCTDRSENGSNGRYLIDPFDIDVGLSTPKSLRRPFRNRFGNHKRYSDRTTKWVFEESSPRKGSGDGLPEQDVSRNVMLGSTVEEFEESRPTMKDAKNTIGKNHQELSRFFSKKRQAPDDTSLNTSERAAKVSKTTKGSAKSDSKVKTKVQQDPVDPFAKTFQLVCQSETTPEEADPHVIASDSGKGQKSQKLSESAISNLRTLPKSQTSDSSHLNQYPAKEKRGSTIQISKEDENLSECGTLSSLENDLKPKMLLFSPHHKRKSVEVQNKTQKRLKAADELIRIDVNSFDDDDTASDFSQNNIFVEKVEARIKLAFSQMAKVSF